LNSASKRRPCLGHKASNLSTSRTFAHSPSRLRTGPAGRRAAGADRHSCTARSPRCAAWQGWVQLRPRAWPPAGTAAPRGLSNRGLLSTPRAMDSNRQS
jgi:hypothetical protein